MCIVCRSCPLLPPALAADLYLATWLHCALTNDALLEVNHKKPTDDEVLAFSRRSVDQCDMFTVL